MLGARAARHPSFVLHLPLRLRAHDRGEGGLIEPYFPGDPPQLEALARTLAQMEELGALVEQLRWIREISAWELTDGDELRLLGRAIRRGQKPGLSRPQGERIQSP